MLTDLLGEGPLDPQAQAYLAHLTTLPLDSLQQQPTLVASEASSVDFELVNLCFREYPTFISVHKCSAAVTSAFDDFEDSLGKLIASVPALEEECRYFTRGTSAIQKARNEAALVQEHQDRLMDLLEIPQLMETCVRNGYYQEAMELANHAEQINDQSAIVQDVAAEVQAVLQVMSTQLLSLLREPVKLPTLVKAVSYLRRLGRIDEEELGLLFLTSRLHNFRTQLMGIERDRSEPVRYLRRYIDHFREHVYDIISQSTAIFTGMDKSTLASFAALCVDDLAQLVSSYVPRVASDPAALSSILVQIGYCSMSFARLGLEFSDLVVQSFGRTVLSTYAQAVAAAADAFGDAISDLAKKGEPPSMLVSSDELAAVLSSPTSPPARYTDSSRSSDPSRLAHYPLVARYLNAHYTALNALRLLAPLDSAAQLERIQAASFRQSISALLEYIDQANDTARPTGARHARTPSSPRMQLVRQNTETQLSHEARAARKRESRRVSVAFVDAWLWGMELAREGLSLVYEGVAWEGRVDGVERLQAWVERYGEAEAPRLLWPGKQMSSATEEEPHLVKGSSPPSSVFTFARSPKPIQHTADGKSSTTALSLNSPKTPSPGPGLAESDDSVPDYHVDEDAPQTVSSENVLEAARGPKQPPRLAEETDATGLVSEKDLEAPHDLKETTRPAEMTEAHELVSEKHSDVAQDSTGPPRLAGETEPAGLVSEMDLVQDAAQEGVPYMQTDMQDAVSIAGKSDAHVDVPDTATELSGQDNTPNEGQFESAKKTQSKDDALNGDPAQDPKSPPKSEVDLSDHPGDENAVVDSSDQAGTVETPGVASAAETPSQLSEAEAEAPATPAAVQDRSQGKSKKKKKKGKK